jgi:hypothetical protein
MNHEIRKSIGCNSKSDEEQIVNSSFNAIVEKHDTRHGKKSQKISLRSKTLAYLG